MIISFGSVRVKADIRGKEVVSLELMDAIAPGASCGLLEVSEWVNRKGLLLHPNVARYIQKTTSNIITAFAYINGKLYFGLNHLSILDNAREWGDEQEEKSCFGWLFEDGGQIEAEFYSDFMDNPNDTELFNEVYHKLRMRYPEITSVSFGPDPETMKQMQDTARKWAEV